MLKEGTILNKTAYFNNAATTFPKPEEVYSFMDSYYRQSGTNIGRGGANTGSNLIKETRNLITEIFHCPNKKVVFVPSATEALNIILQGLTIANNFNIYVSPFEHNAVTRVIGYLQTKYKLNVKELEVDKNNLKYDLEKIKYQFSEDKPNIVVISHASNVCGILAPIEDICTMSKQYGAVNIIDMCQTAGLVEIDLSYDIYDFNVFAGHKTMYGPFGIAGFICSGDISLKPLLYGGTGVDSANITVPETLPDRFEVGSQNILAVAGLNASLKWIKTIGIKNIFKKERENHNRLISLLHKYDNIKIIGECITNEGVGVVSCIFDGYSCDNIGQILNEHGVEVRTGLHCSPKAHKFLNTFPEGTVRFSVSYFNTDDDFEVLKDSLDYIEENS